MGWCASCGKVVVTERDEINGFTCCTGCGRVLDDNVYSSDPMFSKGAGGQSQMEGNYVRDGQHSGFGRFGGRTLGTQSDSHEKTLNKGLFLGVTNQCASLLLNFTGCPRCFLLS